jgi:hypothetical protein
MNNSQPVVIRIEEPTVLASVLAASAVIGELGRVVVDPKLNSSWLLRMSYTLADGVDDCALAA